MAPDTEVIPSPRGREIAQAIYRHYAAHADPPRPHLGGSEIGAECARRIWYGFRWAYDRKLGDGSEADTGRVLRLFQRGHREEAFFIADLRALGLEVYECDPNTGKQWHFTAFGGHFGCSLDGVIRRMGEREWGLLECKTHNDDSFKALQENGVYVAKPQHWYQMQCYMHMSGLRWALYLSVNKDNDELYSEIIEYNREDAERMMMRTKSIIFAAEPPEPISRDPAFFKCKLCPAREVCFGYVMPRVNLRTCAHATPMPDGTWHCDLCNRAIPLEEQRDGNCACGDSHVYIPALIAHRYEHIGSVDGGKTARLRDRKTGREFNNGAGGVTSAELRALGDAAMDEAIEDVRAAFSARVVPAVSGPLPGEVDGAKVADMLDFAKRWARPDKEKLAELRTGVRK